MEPGLDRAGRDVEPACDLAHRKVAVVAERDDDAVLGRQGRDRVRQEVVVMRLSIGVVGRDRDFARDVDGLPSRGSQPITTRVDEDPVEPRLEARRIA